MQNAHADQKTNFLFEAVVDAYEKIGDSQFFSWQWAIIDVVFLSALFFI